MRKVKSTYIESLDYDEETKTLIVTFRSTGKTYTYDAVPAEEHEKLMAAPSIGRHFLEHIKGKYEPTLIPGQFRHAPDPDNVLGAG